MRTSLIVGMEESKILQWQSEGFLEIFTLTSYNHYEWDKLAQRPTCVEV